MMQPLSLQEVKDSKQPKVNHVNYSKQRIETCLQVPSKELDFTETFDETWLDFFSGLRAGIWGLFTQIGIGAIYISNTYLLFQKNQLQMVLEVLVQAP